MDCSQVLELVNEYVDVFLPEEILQQVEAHLKHCDVCKKEVEALAALRTEIRAVRLENTDDFVFDVERAKAPVEASFVRKGWIRSIGAVAACLVLFVGIYAAVDNGYHTPGEEKFVLGTADATKDVSAPHSAVRETEDKKELKEENNKENNNKRAEATSKTGATQTKKAPEVVVDASIANAPMTGENAAARVSVTEDKPYGTQSAEVAQEEAAVAVRSNVLADDLKEAVIAPIPPSAEQSEPVVSGGGSSAVAQPTSGGSASGIIPAPTYTKRMVTLSVSPEAEEMFSYILSGMPLNSINGDTLLGESDLNLLLCVDGVQIVSDQSLTCDSEDYLGKIVLIY